MSQANRRLPDLRAFLIYRKSTLGNELCKTWASNMPSLCRHTLGGLFVSVAFRGGEDEVQ